jgi:hypothetical protein
MVKGVSGDRFDRRLHRVLKMCQDCGNAKRYRELRLVESALAHQAPIVTKPVVLLGGTKLACIQSTAAIDILQYADTIESRRDHPEREGDMLMHRRLGLITWLGVISLACTLGTAIAADDAPVG